MRLPVGTDIRLCTIPELAAFVLLAPPPLTAGMHLLDRLGELSALITHDAGVVWPDKRGIALAEATLAQGSAVVLQFERVVDAVLAHRRLTAAMAH